jgi:hypothetical protein
VAAPGFGTSARLGRSNDSSPFRSWYTLCVFFTLRDGYVHKAWGLEDTAKRIRRLGV